MAKSTTADVTFVVTRSFGTLNEGERFESPRDEWTKAHEAAGLLREVPREGQDQAGEG